MDRLQRKDRVKPTHYPVLPFHAIRSAQLVSSLIVACIMGYFLRELQHEHYRLPWTFILLLAVSLLTIVALSATIVLHCFYGLNPVLNVSINSVLLVLWCVSFGLLCFWSSGTLTHVCNMKNWKDDTGVSICRTYKALFSFSLFGLVGTLVAVILDVHVQRNATKKGKFAKLQLVDNKREFEGEGEVLDGGWEENPNPVRRERMEIGERRGGDGYALPEEQYAYEEDTTYHGAGGQVGRRSVEGRMF